MVILTMSEGMLHVLLVCRVRRRSRGCGRSRAASSGRPRRWTRRPGRELAEETGVDAPSLLTQFGAYGDPGRDPRMNVVTVGYLAVLRDVGAIAAWLGRRRGRASSRSPTC